MSARPILVRALCVGLMLTAALHAAHAYEASPDVAPAATKPRMQLSESRIEAAPLEGGQFRLRARLAPAESAGELREAEGFVLIGRFAKAGQSCSADTIFRHGFEGN